MITCRVGRDGVFEQEETFTSQLVLEANAAGRPLWVDVTDPDEGELAVLRATLGLHELAVEDSLRWGQRTKVEFYVDHLFLVAHGLDLDPSDELMDREVHLFAAAGRYVVTVRREPRLELHKLLARSAAGSGPDGGGIGYLLYLLLDEVVDGYLDTVERLEDLGDDIEQAVADEADGAEDDDASGQISRRIFELRRAVVRFRRLAAPMREAVNLVLEVPAFATRELVPYYRDVLDHVIRTLELTDNVRDLLTSARELQLAQASNRLNVVMKQLSAWAGIILVPTMIAGIYGMNFERMPELGWVGGYPLALALMVGSAFALFRVFRRRRWL